MDTVRGYEHRYIYDTVTYMDTPGYYNSSTSQVVGPPLHNLGVKD